MKLTRPALGKAISASMPSNFMSSIRAMTAEAPFWLGLEKLASSSDGGGRFRRILLITVLPERVSI